MLLIGNWAVCMNLIESSVLFQLKAVGSLPQTSWWYTPLLSGGVCACRRIDCSRNISYLAHRNDRRRSEPKLLKQCADFSAACGRLKRELSTKKPEGRDLGDVRQLEGSHDALIIIGTPEIESAAERFIGMLQIVLDTERSGDASGHDEALSGLFTAHRKFIDSVRKHFNRPKKNLRCRAHYSDSRKAAGAQTQDWQVSSLTRHRAAGKGSCLGIRLGR